MDHIKIIEVLLITIFLLSVSSSSALAAVNSVQITNVASSSASSGGYDVKVDYTLTGTPGSSHTGDIILEEASGSTRYDTSDSVYFSLSTESQSVTINVPSSDASKTYNVRAKNWAGMSAFSTKTIVPDGSSSSGSSSSGSSSSGSSSSGSSSSGSSSSGSSSSGSSSTSTTSSTSINFCSGGKSTPQTIRLVFTILSVLGPVFGTLFFVGMSVADSATTKQKYKGQRRRVLLLGFGVPVSIAFLETIGNKLTQGTDITCFFP